MKSLFITIGAFLLGVGLLAGFVAGVNSREWQNEKHARLSATYFSSVNAFAASMNETNALMSAAHGSVSENYRELHDERMNVLWLSGIFCVISLVGGIFFLAISLTMKRQINPAMVVVPPRLQNQTSK